MRVRRTDSRAQLDAAGSCGRAHLSAPRADGIAAADPRRYRSGAARPAVLARPDRSPPRECQLRAELRLRSRLRSCRRDRPPLVGPVVDALHRERRRADCRRFGAPLHAVAGAARAARRQHGARVRHVGDVFGHRVLARLRSRHRCRQRPLRPPRLTDCRRAHAYRRRIRPTNAGRPDRPAAGGRRDALPGLLRQPAAARRGVHGRWLVSHRRPRAHRPRRAFDHRARQGRHHRQWRQLLRAGDRKHGRGSRRRRAFLHCSLRRRRPARGRRRGVGALLRALRRG